MRAFKTGGIDALYGISAEVIAELCGVHITTARRWKRGEEPTFAAFSAHQAIYDRRPRCGRSEMERLADSGRSAHCC